MHVILNCMYYYLQIWLWIQQKLYWISYYVFVTGFMESKKIIIGNSVNFSVKI